MVKNIIKENLKVKNLSQKELAIKANLTPQVISEIVLGKRNPSNETLLKIENALDFPEFTLIKIKKNYKKYLQQKNDEGINEIANYLNDINKFKLLARESLIEKAGNIIKADKVANRKKEFLLSSKGFRKFKDKPLAYLWLALLENKYANLKSSGTFKKSSGETIIKKTLDILISKETIDNRIEKLKKHLDKHGIILINAPFIPDSTINGATFKRNTQRFIFMSDMKKREYQYIFGLIHELFHYYNDDFKHNDKLVAKYIKEYLKKYNKTHPELELSFKIFEAKDSERDWDFLYKNTKLKIHFGSIEDLLLDY